MSIRKRKIVSKVKPLQCSQNDVVVKFSDVIRIVHRFQKV